MEAKKTLRSLVIFLFVIYVPFNLIAQNWIPVYRFSNGTSTTFEHLYTTNSTEVTTWKNENIAFYVSDTYFSGSVAVYRLKKDGTPRLRLLTSNESEKLSALSTGYILENTLGYIFPYDSQTGNIIYRSYKESVGDRLYTMNFTEYNTTLNNGYKAETNLGRTFSEKPNLEINTNEFNFSSISGANSVSISANVSWTASSNQSWLSISSGSNGNNNGSVYFNYTANESSNLRSATLTLSSPGLTSKTITITQQGKSLSLLISPSGEKSVTNQSGTGSINVVSNISWTASSNQNWLTISSGATGNNDGTVSYNYLANETTISRTAIITISGNGVSTKNLTVIQEGKTANLTISPNGGSTINSLSGSGSISVTSNVDWSASSNQSWLTITSGSSGKNDGVINYTYSTNTNSTSRSVTISVTGNGATTQTLTLNQSGQQPEITFNPTGPIKVPSTAGEARVLISSNANWEAATTDNWLTIFPSAGVANTPMYSTIYYSEKKTNANRTGYITFAINGIAKATIEVTQTSSNQISISFDVNGVSHLAWPFYSIQDKISNNPISTWSNRNGWMSGREWETNHPKDSSWGNYWGFDTHINKDYYADDWNNHNQDDCNMDFYAPLSGRVLWSGEKNGYGNTIIIQSDINDEFAFLVAHLSSLAVKENIIVNVGDKIGEIGNTGTGSHGCHAHCSLYNNIPLPFSMNMNIDNSSKFEFDAISGGSGGSLFFGNNCYGFTNSGSFFIAKSMIDEVQGITAKVCYWNYDESIWYERDMTLEDDFYVYHSNNVYNDYRDYCIRVYTNEGETWLPSAVRDFIANKDDFKANPANDGYNFYTKPVISIPLVACAEETSVKNVNQEKYKIYPNPAKDVLNISNIDSNYSYTIQIFDITGGIVFSKYLFGNSAVNINGLKSGLYIVKIQVEKNIYYDKIIIEK